MQGIHDKTINSWSNIQCGANKSPVQLRSFSTFRFSRQENEVLKKILFIIHTQRPVFPSF